MKKKIILIVTTISLVVVLTVILLFYKNDNNEIIVKTEDGEYTDSISDNIEVETAEDGYIKYKKIIDEYLLSIGKDINKVEILPDDIITENDITTFYISIESSVYVIVINKNVVTIEYMYETRY